MIDNDQNNEEYKLDDLDLLASEPEDQLQPEVDALSTSSEPVSDNPTPFWQNPTLRNGVIAVGCLVLLVMCYQLISSFFSSKNPAQNDITPVVVMKPALHVSQPVVRTFPDTQTDTSKLDKQLLAIVQDQSVMSSNIQTINGQMTTVSSSVSDIATKITELNNTILAMNEKMDAQSREIERLVAVKAKKRSMPGRKMNGVGHEGPQIYSLQAVIPGRAWIMSNNGATLTVREGTTIAGYGVVKLIDPQQGRVVTSSGRTIRFSQIDS